VGDSSFAAEADRLALAPGIAWDEQSVGTNAIGTSLFEGRQISIIGAEHFLDSNSALSCSAVPIIGPLGSVVGALDLSTPATVPHSHALALVRRAVEQIERRLFEHAFGRHERMHLHSNPYLLGSCHDALLAFESDRLVGASRNAIDLLGLAWSAVGKVRFGQLFSVQHGTVQRNATCDECVVQTTRGTTLFARMEPAPRVAAGRAIAAEAAGPAPPAESGYRAESEPAPPPQVILQRLLSSPVSHRLRLRKARAGVLIHGRDEADESLLVVCSGRLRAFASCEGKELTLFMLDAGDALVLHPESMLEVKKDCEFILLRQSTFRALARDDPELALAVVPAMERLVGQSVRLLEQMAFHDVKHRVVRALCDIAGRDGRSTVQGVLIEVAPNGEDLAMQVGATRQSVSTVIAGLIRAGVLARRGASAMMIPDPGRLQAELT
jgi:CRP-like cAMP-binding protein